MRKLFPSLLICYLLCSLGVEAQTDVTIRKKDFKTGKSGFDEAWKNVSDGDSYYAEKGVWYGRAFDEYIKAIVYNNSNAELNYKTGVSALFSDNKEEAAAFLLKALELKKDVAPDILILTGHALQYAGRYSEANEKFSTFMTSPVEKTKEEIALVNKLMEECNSALLVTKDTLRISIENLGSNINSSSDDYSEVLSSDGSTMYFGSRRQLPNSGKRNSDTKFDENILVAHQANGSWEQAVPAGKNLNTKFCETPLYINSTNDILYVYTGYENGGDIKMSVKKKGDWKSPEKLPFPINSKGSETSFCIRPFGNEIYFVTDKGKDNMGGKDIYFIKKLSDRKWSKPLNAGNKINTKFDEESPRFSKSGDTLWFSSRGHNSIGGFDIFFSVKNAAGEWDSVRNSGYPLNTAWDEVFYNPSTVDDSAFYFVSNRSGGIGGLDIYRGRILPPKPVVVIIPPAPPKPDTVIVIKEVVAQAPPVVQPAPVSELVLFLAGKIIDADSGEPVMAKIDVIDKNTNEVVATTASSDVDGSYRVRLPAKKTYMIDLKATGFLSDTKRIDVPENWPKDVYTLNLELIKVKVGKKVVLKNILFETGKAILTPGSSAELDRLLNIMKDNPLMKIEISGHTDKTGSEPVNFKLSENRAKAVVDYLVRKGIPQSRMEFRGYGSLQPVADNSTSQGRAKNRRVEFKILEF
jgi:outer membrane protein OmpA-like peptidoglycan-associated protein